MDDGGSVAGPMAAGTWLARLRWRRRGAWMWPSFIALTVVDGAIGSALPPLGETQAFVGAMLVGAALNLLSVVLLSRPLGAVLRRFRRDLPAFIARDYAGTVVLAGVSTSLLLAGLGHHSSVMAARHSMAEAIVRAQAYAGDRAPAEFRRNLSSTSTYAITAGSVYRVCIRSQLSSRTYCMIVKPMLPFANSVAFDGYEPNSVFSEGTQ